MLLVALLAAVIWGIGAAMGVPRAARVNMLAPAFCHRAGAADRPARRPPGPRGYRRVAGALADPCCRRGAGPALSLDPETGCADRPPRSRRRVTRRSPRCPRGRSAMRSSSATHATSPCPISAAPGSSRSRDAKVLVIGAGGLGAPALLYLAAAGVGRIGIVDGDTVALSNLQRQVIHTDARQDMPKVFSAQAAIEALNPHVDTRPYKSRAHRRYRGGAFRRIRSDPRRHGQLRDPRAGQSRGGGRGAPRPGGCHQRVGGADHAL